MLTRVFSIFLSSLGQIVDNYKLWKLIVLSTCTYKGQFWDCLARNGTHVHLRTPPIFIVGPSCTTPVVNTFVSSLLVFKRPSVCTLILKSLHKVSYFTTDIAVDLSRAAYFREKQEDTRDSSGRLFLLILFVRDIKADTKGSEAPISCKGQLSWL